MLRLAVRFGVTRRQVLLVVILATVACAFAAVQAFQHRARVTDVPVTTIGVADAGGSVSAAATRGTDGGGRSWWCTWSAGSPGRAWCVSRPARG